MGNFDVSQKYVHDNGAEEPPTNKRATLTVTILTSLIMFCVTCQLTYLADIQPTIRKRFGLTEAESGNIVLANDISQVVSIMIVTHFLSKVGKARGIALAVLLMVVGIVLWIIPHFLSIEAPSSLYNKTQAPLALCKGNNSDTCAAEKSPETSVLAYQLFIAGQALFGAGWAPAYTLGLPLIAANVEYYSVPIAIGVAWAMDSFGIFVGTYIAVGFLSVPEHLSGSDVSASHHAWVGAWWLGLIVMAGFTLLVASALCIVPQKMEVSQKDEPMPGENVIKGLFFSVWRLVRNFTFIFLMLAGACKFYVFSGLFMYLPQFLDVQFKIDLTDSKALVGVLTGIVPALGVIVGGVIATRLKYGHHDRGTGMLIVLTFISALLVTSLLAVGCPSHSLSGENPIEGYTGDMPCNAECGCPADSFNPVCGDGYNFLSACHAGCTKGTNMNFSECACTPSRKVTPGFCEVNCGNLIPYAILFGAAMFALFMTDALYLTFCMRVVDVVDRPMAIAVITAFMTLIAFLPAAALFENVLSGACIWRPVSCGSKGDCMLYDLIQFRFLYHSTALIFLIIATAFLVGAWYRLKTQRTRMEKKDTDILPGNIELHSGAFPGGEIQN